MTVQSTLQFTATHTLHLAATHRNTNTTHTATHCNTLLQTDDRTEHTAIRCNSLQHAAIHCSILQHTYTGKIPYRADYIPLQLTATHCNSLQLIATHCNTLQHMQHTASHSYQQMTVQSTQQPTATHCTSIRHAATRCNTLQHTATRCNTRIPTNDSTEHAASHCN